MTVRRGLAGLLLTFVNYCLFASAVVLANPVDAFIVRADSIADAGGAEALDRFVQANTVLVGAAVGDLLDRAIESGDRGDQITEEKNFSTAERLARIYEHHTGSSAPLDLVLTYKNWTPAQRAVRAQARDLEAQAKAARGAKNLTRAIELYHEARGVYEQVDDKRSVAINWGSLGVAAWFNQDFDSVAEFYGQALSARRAIDDRILEGRTLNGFGGLNQQLNKLQEAIEWYGQAAALRRRTADLEGLSKTLTFMADAHRDLGHLVEARALLEEVVPIVEQTGNSLYIINAWTAIGNVFLEMGVLDKSVTAYRRAIATAARTGDYYREAQARINLATTLRVRGSYREALDELDRAEKALDVEPDDFQLVSLYRERGLTHLRIGETGSARDELLACVELARVVKDPVVLAEAMINLGSLYQELGAYSNGLAVAKDARKQAEQTQHSLLIRNATVLIAQLEQSFGHPKQALGYWREVLERDERDQSWAAQAEDRLGIASVLVSTGRSAAARKEYRTVQAMLPGLEREDLSQFVHLGLADTYEQENPDSAVYHYERALAILERSRSRIGGAEVRTGFLQGERRFFYEEVARYYASMSESGRRSEWSDRAFRTMERAKARGLLDLLEQSVRAGSSVNEQALLDSLYQLDTKSTADAKRKDVVKKKYLKLREQRVKGSLGHLAAGADVTGIRELQRKLPRHTVWLEYALGDTVSLLWAIDRKGADLFEVPNRKQLRMHVDRLRDAIARPGVGDAVLRKTARALYTALVAPAENRLKKAKSVIIVPDGVLFEAPFEVFLSAEGDDSRPWSDQPFLARSFSMIYAPSASVFLKLQGARKRSARYSRELLAVGDPDFSTLPAIRGEAAGLARLPHTRSEVMSISSHVKDKEKHVLLGRGANEARFKEALRDDSPRIVHLATHGLINPIEPVSSSIALCANEGSGEDGYLHTLEILSLPFDVGLVVLSACESARGKVGRGEGVVGLSRAFIASGATGVVASLWAVSDESTAQLMEKFYEQMLGKKKSAGKALNEARLALMENPDYSHPFYWSPFIVIGTERSPW